MDIDKHILYHFILSNHDAFPDIVNTFRKIMEEREIEVKAKGLHKRLGSLGLSQELLDRDQRNALKIVSTFIESFSAEEVLEYVHYGKKENIVRRILHYLELEHENFHEVYKLLEEFYHIPLGSAHLPTTMTLDARVHLITNLISSHLSFVSIAKNYVNLRDIAVLLEHNISSINRTGQIGGKAAGMLLANRILRPTLETIDLDLGEGIEEIESYFVKSSAVSEFISMNALEETHSLKYLEGDEFDAKRLELQDRFMAARFPQETVDLFKNMLKKTKGHPLILRSSSYLEEGIGCSFTGKYDSIFISNVGSMGERMDELFNAIKLVYFSLYSSSVIQYRKDKKLLDYNERMSILIQKVVGERYGKYFFPAMGIVGFSRNSYCWNSKIKAEDGMLRMVMGLGTRAVDRVGDDCPRLTSLSAPSLRPEATTAEKIKYSQKYVDVLNLETREVETVHFVDLINELWEQGIDLNVDDMVSVERDGMLAVPMFQPDRLEYNRCAITFEGILKNKRFTELMKKVFTKVESAYGHPVDMEFAYHKDKLYVLQCRTLTHRESAGAVEFPDVLDEHVLFATNVMTHGGVIEDVKYLVYVDRRTYDSISTAEKKFETARVIGKINRFFENDTYLLLGPGRWGSNDVNLGIPVRYGDINNTSVLIEMGWPKDGVVPELSYGTHFFQDLVEADIIPLPIYPEDPKTVFISSFFDDADNCYDRFEGLPDEFADLIKVIDVSKAKPGYRLNLYSDSVKGQVLAAFLPTGIAGLESDHEESSKTLASN